MSIRSGAKAIIIKDGSILLNRCAHKDGSIYYDLPGGGQKQHEALEDAILREVKEETGYTARILRFAALAEEIHTNPFIREKYPEYSHRMLHIFLAEPTDDEPQTPTELDHGMESHVWLSLTEFSQLREVYPPSLPDRIDEILASPGALWLGTAYK